MKKLLILLCMSAFCLLSCNHVPSNPQKGAEKFCKEMSRYAKSNNYGEAYDRLSRYEVAYDSDQYNQFCWALRDKLKSSEYNHANAFIDSMAVQVSEFLYLKAHFIATSDEELDKCALEVAIKQVGKISAFEGSGECRITYNRNTNEVKLILETDKPIDGKQKVDKQLAIEELWNWLSSDMLFYITRAEASLSFWYSDNSQNLELAKYPASYVEYKCHELYQRMAADCVRAIIASNNLVASRLSKRFGVKPV